MKTFILSVGLAALIFGPAAESRLLAQGPKNRVKLENANPTRGPIHPERNYGARSVAFSPDGKTLAAAYNDRDGTIRFWDVASGKNIATIKAGGLNEYYPCSVAFSPDGKTLASQGTEIILWDVASGKRTAVLGKNADNRIIGSSLAFSPDGKTLASGGTEIILWDVASGKKTAALGRAGFSLAFSPDGKSLASGGGGVFLWDVASGKNIVILKDGWDNMCVAISPNGKTLAAPGKPIAEPGSPYGTSGKTVQLWDIATGKNTANLKTATENYGPDCVQSVAFSADGKTLATGSMCVIKFWNVATGEKTADFTAHTHWVHSMAFSSDGKTFASASEHGDNAPLVKLWDLTLFSRAPVSEHGITGKWAGTYVNNEGVKSEDSLEITENEDGTLTGTAKILPGKEMKIVNGERVTADVLQWEYATAKHHWRVRCTVKGEALELHYTYTWKEAGKVKGGTGASSLTRVKRAEVFDKKDTGQVKPDAPAKGLEEEAVRAIEKLRGSANRDVEAPGKPVIEVNLTNATWVTDADLKPLKEFKNLQHLSLSRCFKVTDAGLKEFKDNKRLYSLFLCQTKVTDAGVKELKGLQELRALSLSGTEVTAAGLKELKELKNLEYLILSYTKGVTDAVVKELKELKGLKTLVIVSCPISEAGLKELTEALPKCQILR